MGTDSTSRTLITLALLALLGAAVWLVRDLLPPFLIAFALALLLDPLLDRIQRWGLPRWAAVALTFLAFLTVFFGVIAILVPLAIGQIAELIRNLPEYGQKLGVEIDAWALRNAELLYRLGLPPNLSELWQENQGNAGRYVELLLRRGVETVQASAGILSWLLVVPIVTLYLLMDLDALKARCHHLIAAPHREVAAELGTKVGRIFAAYLRGLTLICGSFGLVVFLVLALGFHLPYALILGLLAAVLYAVPYLGQIILLIVACAVAWATGRHTPGYLVALAIVLVLVGQLFDQLITPRVIGKSGGLHPVIGLFALMVGGHLFGLPGMVMAVPVAASLRIVLLHLFPRLGEPLEVKHPQAEPLPAPE